jgi:uncharacterized repeat protein (TIGR01451 family)
VAVGDRISVDVVVSNLGPEERSLTLSITLPQQLGYVSSEPPGFVAGGGPPPLGEFIGVDLGPVPAGGTVEASLELEGLEPTPAGAVPVLFEVTGDGEAASTEFLLEVLDDGNDPGSPLALTATPPSDILGQLGDRLDYGLTVSNAGDEPLEDVIVVERVPSEVRVVDAPLVKGIDAVQVGRFLAREDIVWVIEELAPRERVRLPWRGVVQAAGDLEANAAATASARRTPRVKAAVTSYLASPDAPSADVNPPFTPIARRVPIQVPVPASSSGGSLLPFTGLGVWTWLVSGVLIVLAGFALYRFGLPTARGKRIPGVLALMCVVAVACFSSSDSEPSATGSPEVQGRRIERGGDGETTTVDPGEEEDTGTDENDGSEEDATDNTPEEGSTDGDASENDSPENDPPASDTDANGEVDTGAPSEDAGTETITRFVIEEVTLADLPVRTAPSTEGSFGSFAWSDTSRTVTSAASSRSFVAGAPLTVVTSVHDVGGTINVDVTLVNESDDERISVTGVLDHSVSGSGGVLATFDSDPIDTILSPGGRVTATFEYLLPSGTYSIDGSFVAGA